MAERDRADLPFCETAQISLLQQSYESAVRNGEGDAPEKCFSLTWGLVHSRSPRDQLRGIELADAMLLAENAEDRELLYLKAVGYYRLRRYVDCRTTLKTVLALYPDFRQAATLLDSAENQLIKEGLIGVGAGAAILGVVSAVVIAAARRR